MSKKNEKAAPSVPKRGQPPHVIQNANLLEIPIYRFLRTIILILNISYIAYFAFVNNYMKSCRGRTRAVDGFELVGMIRFRLFTDCPVI